MSEIRKSITLFDDQYNFCKELKSKKLLIAFVEYMFEDIEPTGLKNLEQITFNSLRKRMDNSKKKSLAWSISKWGWRPRKDSWELNVKNNRKTTEQTTKKQEEEDKDIRIKENNKRKYLDNVLLSEEEYNKLIERYGKWTIERKIEDLNNYIGSKWKKYKSHYFTILERLRREWAKPLEKKQEKTENNDLDIDTRASWLREAFPLNK